VLVAGATGYVGRRLVSALVGDGEEVVCLARRPEKLAAEPWRRDVDVVCGDVLDASSLPAAFAGVDVAYYLVHSMGGAHDFALRDLRAARHFRQAAVDAGTRQIVYLGELGDAEKAARSSHLRSSRDVGRELAGGTVPVTELRAASIIGAGSASFEMVRHLVAAPVMLVPRWARAQGQPIAIRDVLGYLRSVLDEPAAYGQVYEIGGADVLTLAAMLRTYAAVAERRTPLLVPVPVRAPRLSSRWIALVTPLPRPLARALVDGQVDDVTVHDDAIAEIDDRTPLGYRAAVELARREVEGADGR
jgi:uncharacterized protein YbjT (DUF2867 family)